MSLIVGSTSGVGSIGVATTGSMQTNPYIVSNGGTTLTVDDRKPRVYNFHDVVVDLYRTNYENRSVFHAEKSEDPFGYMYQSSKEKVPFIVKFNKGTVEELCAPKYYVIISDNEKQEFDNIEEAKNYLLILS